MGTLISYAIKWILNSLMHDQCFQKNTQFNLNIFIFIVNIRKLVENIVLFSVKILNVVTELT